jgi:hypothetical protein
VPVVGIPLPDIPTAVAVPVAVPTMAAIDAPWPTAVAAPVAVPVVV